MTPPGAHDDRYFHVCAALIVALAAIQAVIAALTFQWFALVTAVAWVCIALYLHLYPGLRDGWYGAGYKAATPTLPLVKPGDNGGYVIVASEAVERDPHRQALMVAVRGVTVRPLLDEHDRYTADWIVTVPLPRGALVERVEVRDLPP